MSAAVLTAEEAAFRQIGPWRLQLDYRGAVILPVDPAGRVVLQFRDHNPEAVHPGEWGFFGGGVKPGETLRAAARREFREETGVEAQEADFRPFARIVSPVSGRPLFLFELPIAAAPADIRLAEGAGFAFFEPQDIPRLPLVGAVRILLAAWLRASHGVRSSSPGAGRGPPAGILEEE